MGIYAHMGIHANRHLCLYRQNAYWHKWYAYIVNAHISVHAGIICLYGHEYLYGHECLYIYDYNRHSCLYGHLLYRHIIYAYRHLSNIGINVYIGMNAYISIYAHMGINAHVGIYAFKGINAHIGINAYIGINAHIFLPI